MKKNKGKKYGGIKYGKKVQKKQYVKKLREKRYGVGGKGKSHVTSGDVTFGQACAMVRSSGSSSWFLLKCYFVTSYILLLCMSYRLEMRFFFILKLVANRGFRL